MEKEHCVPLSDAAVKLLESLPHKEGNNHIFPAERAVKLSDMALLMVPASDEADILADIYIDERIISDTHRYDSLHIAVTTTNDLEYIFSLNFKHINKIKTKTMTSLINIREGYKPIVIASPMEAIENEEKQYRR